MRYRHFTKKRNTQKVVVPRHRRDKHSKQREREREVNTIKSLLRLKILSIYPAAAMIEAQRPDRDDAFRALAAAVASKRNAASSTWFQAGRLEQSRDYKVWASVAI